jgi:hypothetical protein
MVVGTRIATLLSTALKAAGIATSVLPNPITKTNDPLDDRFPYQL